MGIGDWEDFSLAPSHQYLVANLKLFACFVFKVLFALGVAADRPSQARRIATSYAGRRRTDFSLFRHL
ncbi:hypothetical protein [Nostoc linckia]|uniref:hypothetical protein n=1 Tax=Nostoc linckia TaxID=92942 RepID=UPI00117C8B9A|nr:hypothetical protein [Nostoc linckia]